MATKDLIKKMTSARDVKPSVMENKSPDVEMVSVVDTVEETVEHELKKIQEPKNLPTVEFMDKELKVLRNEIQSLQNQLIDMNGKVQVTFGLINEINNKIDEMKLKKPSLWRKLFKNVSSS